MDYCNDAIICCLNFQKDGTHCMHTQSSNFLNLFVYVVSRTRSMDMREQRKSGGVITDE